MIRYDTEGQHTSVEADYFLLQMTLLLNYLKHRCCLNRVFFQPFSMLKIGNTVIYSVGSVCTIRVLLAVQPLEGAGRTTH